MKKLHSVYVGRCRAFRKNHFSIFKFTEYFKENSFSPFKRKKDRCNTCVGNGEGNVMLCYVVVVGVNDEKCLEKSPYPYHFPNLKSLLIILENIG